MVGLTYAIFYHSLLIFVVVIKGPVPPRHFSQLRVIICRSERLLPNLSCFVLGALKLLIRGLSVRCYVEKLVDLFYITIRVAMRLFQSVNLICFFLCKRYRTSSCSTIMVSRSDLLPVLCNLNKIVLKSRVEPIPWLASMIENPTPE